MTISLGQWQCCVAGKVTVGLASHWPCHTDSVYLPTGSTALRKADDQSDYADVWVWHPLPSYMYLPCRWRWHQLELLHSLLPVSYAWLWKTVSNVKSDRSADSIKSFKRLPETILFTSAFDAAELLVF